MSFTKLGLRNEILQAIESLGFEAPMPIQEQAIPVLLETDGDFIGLAQTGTGKTCAFGLPLLQLVETNPAVPQAIIICPTRELCMQTTEEMRKLSRFMRGVHVEAVYGGASVAQQIRALKRGVQVIVATPGRLTDFIKRGIVDTSNVKIAILDEADEILAMGFKDDLDRILESLPESSRTWLFSATMPKGVADLTAGYLFDPIEITVGTKNESAANLDHVCYRIHERTRYLSLRRFLDCSPDMYGIIFCRTRNETQDLAENLIADGYHAEAIHGDLSQRQRDLVMRKFRTKAVHILTATDVAARGIDVEDVSHVIHYRIPEDPAVYTHRSGRTARAGKSGTSVAFINPREGNRLKAIERIIKRSFSLEKLPDAFSVCRIKLDEMITGIKESSSLAKTLQDLLPAACENLQDLSKEELIEKMLAMQFNPMLNRLQHSDSDLNADEAPQGRRRDRQGKRDRHGKSLPPERFKSRLKNTKRYSINVGKAQRIRKGAIVRLVCDQSGANANILGNINLKKDSTTFELEAGVADAVHAKLKGAKLDGRKVNIRELR